MKKEVRKNICIKVFFMAFIFPFIQSCTTDNNALTSENICMAIISGAGTAPPIPKLPEDRVVLIDSIIETNEIQEYVKTLKRLKKKVEPYTVGLGEEKMKEFRKNMRDEIYTKAYLKNMRAQIDIENELQDLNNCWGKIIVMKLRLKISLTVLLLLLTLCTTIIYSCSSEDYDFEDNSEELKVTTRSIQSRTVLVESIAESDVYMDFIISCDLLTEKMDNYRATLSQEELNEISHNINNVDFVLKLVKKAGVQNEINQIVEARERLNKSTKFSQLNSKEVDMLFYDYTKPAKHAVMLLKKREENTKEGCYEALLKELEMSYSTYYAMMALCDSEPIPALCQMSAETFLQKAKEIAAENYKNCMDKVRGVFL